MQPYFAFYSLLSRLLTISRRRYMELAALFTARELSKSQLNPPRKYADLAGIYLALAR